MRPTLARLIIGASTAGTLIAGLNAGSAKADLSCTFGDFSGCNGPDNGVTFSGWGFAPAPPYQPSTGYDVNDTITISYNSATKSHTIFYNLAATGSGILPGTSGLVLYTASGRTFKDATAFSNVDGDRRTLGFASSFYSVTPFNEIDLDTAYNASINPAVASFAESTTNINGYLGWNSTIPDAQNGFGAAEGFSSTQILTYQDVAVPGPLPVLGAGAAFGFSRRLRRRIQKRA